MRGKRGTPSIWSGADETSGAAELGIELEGEGDPVDPPTSPGGTAGVITKGESGSELELEAAAGATVAESDDGHASVRKDPFDSARVPFRQRATTRNRYVVAGSRPVSVVRPAAASCVTVVGDQTPYRSSAPTSTTKRAASSTRHFTTAEKAPA